MQRKTIAVSARTSLHFLIRKYIRHPILLLSIGLVALVTHGVRAQSLPMLHADGPAIMDAKNQPVVLRGLNVGGWLLQESYILKTDSLNCQWRIKQGLLRSMPEAAMEEFYQQYRAGFVTKEDIDFIANQGFNCVRLPFHYDLFLTREQRQARTKAITSGNTDAYVAALSKWYDANQLFVQPDKLDGVKLIDDVLKWCAANKLYVILDLHAAPGGQGTDRNINDNFKSLDLWKRTDAKGRHLYQDMTVRLWQQLAARYKNDPRVAMYDLINEPHNVNAANGLSTDNTELNALYSRLIDAVRSQNDQHLILLEGNGYGNEYTNLTPDRLKSKSTRNLVYNAHRYWCTNDPQASDPNPNQINLIHNLVAFRDQHKVPVWVGETGENSNDWFATAVQELNNQNIGWCHWTLKRVEGATSLLSVKEYGSILTPEGRAALLRNSRFRECSQNKDVVAALLQPGNKSLPFKKITLPGTIQAVDYDLGRNGVAYSDTYAGRVDFTKHMPWNEGGGYRNDGVDIQKVTDTGSNGYAVGHTEAGEWLHYTVSISKPGAYQVQVRVANATAAPAKLLLKLNQQVVGTLVIGPTGPATWQTLPMTTAALPAGTHTLQLYVEQPGALISWLKFGEPK
ncbi:cellulase family glycosylhydrolase [Hymenobacter sp. BT491]|uniref:cellulase family glycosylhydrolase n=1 Tax=Hymenobacter sp. BT491 TaxID=2766779 RepID=UPI0016537F82|nr:cellulase family glycosylhydrolase [Hymenobacter sp. BT491]MBC6988774.1 cellulase family glycosylhydrolase [Hymenobacter sp. BT491]